MSQSSRARALSASVGLSYQTALQHLQQLSVDSRTEKTYVELLQTATRTQASACGVCSRRHFMAFDPQQTLLSPSCQWESEEDQRGNTYYTKTCCPFCVQASEIVDWFFSRFTNPANGVPYETAEGGYQYYAGGPYDALDQIQDNFDGRTQSVHQAAVKKVELRGFDWIKKGQY